MSPSAPAARHSVPLSAALRSSPAWAADVLEFWFSLTPQQWFAGGVDIDTACHKYLTTHEQLAAQPPVLCALSDSPSPADPATVLAAIISLDQFPRNLFRRSPRAFASDAQARALARTALDRGLDAGLADMERAFMYMPLLHSEALADQDHAVALFKAIASTSEAYSEAARQGNKQAVESAVEHRDIIARFGRFPHRNRWLGRANTAEEEAFIKDHDGFGQGGTDDDGGADVDPMREAKA